MSSKTTELSLDEIFNLAKTALLNNGANEENADAVAATVTNAERDGSVSHGLFRIPGYIKACLLYTSPSPRDRTRSRMPSSA